MIDFNDLVFNRVDIEAFKKEVDKLLTSFKNGNSVNEQILLYQDFIDLRNQAETMLALCYIRYTLNTVDPFYSQEMEIVDEIEPEILAKITEFNQALLFSCFRAELENHYGKVLFEKIEMSVKIYDDSIKEELKIENKLQSEYTKLSASAQIDFQGELRNLSQMLPFMTSKSREIRKSASEKYYGFMKENLREFDQIFDELVKIRTIIAHKLGYKNFVELGYLRMSRLDYNEDMVAAFRQQVVEVIVPIASKLRQRQMYRLGVDKLSYYDMDFLYNSGNPKPQGDAQWIVDVGTKMYDELSQETSSFFREMKKSNLLDLETRKNKSGGGYCFYLNAYKMPFVFSNFNGTEGDVTVLTHEIGHAFQGFMSSHIEVPELMDPSSESAEIHSMSMEFLTYPWMKDFFGVDTDKFVFSHLSDGLLFIPYGVCVDEFQHIIYAFPEYSPEERRRVWRELEHKYMPEKEYRENSYLENGGFWQKQSHIYESPFYYIDYTLAQICAYQYYVKSIENREETWNNYVTLCKLGGTKPFLSLLEEVGLKSPFIKGTIKEIIDTIEQVLEGIDDTKF